MSSTAFPSTDPRSVTYGGAVQQVGPSPWEYDILNEATTPTPRQPGVGPGGSVYTSPQFLGNVGVSVGLQALQYGLGAAKTPQDRRNADELAALEGTIGKGRVRQTAQKRYIDEAAREQMAQVRGLAGEERKRMEAGLAAVGGSTSAGDLDRSRRNEARVVQDQARAVSSEKSKATLVEMGRQLDELESRTAYESERKKRNRQALGQAVQGVAQTAGTIAAAQKQKAGIDWTEFRAAHPNMSDKDLALLYAATRNPNALDDVYRLLGSATTTTPG